MKSVMADFEPPFINPFSAQEAPPQSRYAANVELADRQTSVAAPDSFHSQARRRRNNDRAIIQNPLGKPPPHSPSLSFSFFFLC